jgi:hypothetical protein
VLSDTNVQRAMYHRCLFGRHTIPNRTFFLDSSSIRYFAGEPVGGSFVTRLSPVVCRNKSASVSVQTWNRITSGFLINVQYSNCVLPIMAKLVLSRRPVMGRAGSEVNRIMGSPGQKSDPVPCLSQFTRRLHIERNETLPC